jgi:hypothetical protein
MTPMYWTLQNLKDSEKKRHILHYGSIFSAAMVCLSRGASLDRHQNFFVKAMLCHMYINNDTNTYSPLSTNSRHVQKKMVATWLADEVHKLIIHC